MFSCLAVWQVMQMRQLKLMCPEHCCIIPMCSAITMVTITTRVDAEVIMSMVTAVIISMTAVAAVISAATKNIIKIRTGSR